jgi:hypothetical protein
VVELFVGIAEKVPGPSGSWCSTTVYNNYDTQYKMRVESVLGQIIPLQHRHEKRNEHNREVERHRGGGGSMDKQ